MSIIMGKIRKLSEDIIVLSVIGVVLYGIYSLFLNSSDDTITEKEELIIKDYNISKEKITKKSDEIIINKVEDNISVVKNIKKTEIIIKDKNEKKDIKNTKILEKKVKSVDLRALRAFLIDTQNKVRNNIRYNIDDNGTIIKKDLNFKVTILKDGGYEQLTFVDGDLDLFEKNRENILKIFPLKITDNISDDFPRYFRVKIKK
ncbi:MAG: hypothetical protein U9R37_01205 [Campylobacterota bacterium]|nr:hypothetical protein [Campylobacterota bacterium]